MPLSSGVIIKRQGMATLVVVSFLVVMELVLWNLFMVVSHYSQNSARTFNKHNQYSSSPQSLHGSLRYNVDISIVESSRYRIVFNTNFNLNFC